MWYRKTTDNPICASCYRKEYVANNREKALTAQRKANLSKKSKAARKEYESSDKSRNRRRELDKQRYWQNPDKYRSKNHTEERRAKYREHYKENKPAYTEKASRRRKAVRVSDLGGIFREQTVEIYKNCPEGFEVDHIVPVKGKDFLEGKRQQVICGLHVPWNLQYLPKCENRKKNCNLY